MKTDRNDPHKRQVHPVVERGFSHTFLTNTVDVCTKRRRTRLKYNSTYIVVCRWTSFQHHQNSYELKNSPVFDPPHKVAKAGFFAERMSLLSSSQQHHSTEEISLNGSSDYVNGYLQFLWEYTNFNPPPTSTLPQDQNH